MLSYILLLFTQFDHRNLVQGGYFVCPQQCQAKILPMDMETIEDCLCHGHDNTTSMLHYNKHPSNEPKIQAHAGYRCPENASASRLHPLSFADCICHDGYTRDNMRKLCHSDKFRCLGRYKNKQHVQEAKSIADCDCQTPYIIDERSGECQLLECPRAGHYMKRKDDVTSVRSLADCTCIEPYIKVEESGECAFQNSYACPSFSVPVRPSQPRSFEGCHCIHGYIQDDIKGICKQERQTYVCPPLSYPKHLSIGHHPRGFHDCVCRDEENVKRNEKHQVCERFDNETNHGHEERDVNFQCPPFSRSLSPSPVSIDQCQCFSGYELKLPEMICHRLSRYYCPAHSHFSNYDKIAEETFDDCHCAHGYYRDDHVQECKSWYLAANSGCPVNSFLKNWPLHGNENCECVFGINTSVNAPTPLTSSQTVHINNSEVCNMPVLENSVRLSTHKEKQDYLQCPAHSLANNWPVTTSEDCSCLPGYKMHHIPAAECVSDHKIQYQSGPNGMKNCTLPLVLQERTAHCRLPLEAINQNNVTKGLVVHHGVEYQYALADHNVMVIQGDIAIGTLFSWNNINIPLFHGYYDDARDHRWRNATICFELAHPIQESMLHSAMKHIHDSTKFVFHHCQDNICHRDHTCGHDYIQIVPAASSCYSYIGRVGGRQLLGISPECGSGNMMHVLLHAIGLHHTIDRIDRNDHVRIAWECIPVQQRDFFEIKLTPKSPNRLLSNEWGQTPYDFSSIMHPPSDAFVPNPNDILSGEPAAIPTWCQSIFPLIVDKSKREHVMAGMGQRDRLSEGDVHAVWNLYPELRDHSQRTSHIADNNTISTRYSVYDQLLPSRLHRHDDVLTHGNHNHTHRSYLYGIRDAHLINRHQFAVSFGIMLTAFGMILFGTYAIVEWKRKRYEGWKKHFEGDDRENLFENRAGMSHYGEALLSDRIIFH